MSDQSPSPTLEDLVNRFTYHPPRPGDVPTFQLIRDKGHELARSIRTLTPDSREKDISIERIEEAVMWANAAIARHPIEEYGGDDA